MTWVLVGWGAIILVWLVVAAGQQEDCVTQSNDILKSTGLAEGICQSNSNVGPALVIGFLGFVVLALIWLMRRPAVPVNAPPAPPAPSAPPAPPAFPPPPAPSAE
jgi:hypothetical protein